MASLCLGSPPYSLQASDENPDPLAIFRRECVSCHTESKRKGGLLIDSRESLLKGGDTDAAIVPGKASESFLVELLYPGVESHMPPKGQLTPQEIASIEAWIDAGAPWDSDHWASLNLPERLEVEPGVLPDSYAPVLALALSPDGRILAAARGHRIEWFRVHQEGEEKAPALRLESLGHSEGHRDAVQSLAFSSDGKTLASGGFRSVKLWRLGTAASFSPPQQPEKELEADFLGRQTALLFLRKPDRLLVADSLPSQLGRLHEVHLKSGKIQSFDTAHLDSIFSLVPSEDGTRYATTSADKLITVREAAKHEIVQRLEGHTGYVLAAAFSPDGKRLASAGDDEEVKVWNLETGKKVSAFASKKSGPLYGLAWLTDPANAKKKAEEKDAEKAKAINTDRVFTIAESGKPAAFIELNEHEGAQRSTGARERVFAAVDSPLFAIAVHPERQWLFAGGENGKLYLWDEAGKLRQTVESPAAARRTTAQVEPSEEGKEEAQP